MSESIPAAITVGGRIRRRLLKDLVSMIAGEGVAINWQEQAMPETIRAAIERAAAERTTVTFTDDQTAYGQFDRLERWLKRNKVDFDRHSDARYEYDAENVYCRHGRLTATGSDQGGTDMVGMSRIRAILHRRVSAERRMTLVARLVTPAPDLKPVTLVGKETDR